MKRRMRNGMKKRTRKENKEWNKRVPGVRVHFYLAFDTASLELV